MRFAEPWYLLLFIPFLATLWLTRRKTVWRNPELGVSSLTAIPPAAGIRARASGVLAGLPPLAVGVVLLAAPPSPGGRGQRQIVSQGLGIRPAWSGYETSPSAP